MDLLTAILVTCLYTKDGASDCDIRVRKHIPDTTVEQCQDAVMALGSALKANTLKDPVWGPSLLQIKYRGRCYKDDFALGVIQALPYIMANTESTYTITYYTE